MRKLASELARALKGNEVVFLKGDLGAGKTTFVRFLVEALGPAEGTVVRSPTFTVLNEYETRKGKVFHADLYRVKSFDFTDYEGEGLLLVEWPEFAKNLKPDLEVELEVLDEERRRVRVKDNRGVRR
ncbi:MAG: tRNA (adenosine(37)-N6)-threonylcarbamoyltransferase complex ATPase subunit type 1 TsaE [Aquificae bacterium]|nr:tRNA (adenosine(37)-N6)-threonylcarbamoyltransferase complex ATPase subunit type 1 TsaE [Aquificota bacterium]